MIGVASRVSGFAREPKLHDVEIRGQYGHVFLQMVTRRKA
jgi:hypothetical protein